MPRRTVSRSLNRLVAPTLAGVLLLGCGDSRLSGVDQLAEATYRLPPAWEAEWSAEVTRRIAPRPSAPLAPVHECDLAAADPLDPRRVVGGVAMTEIDPRFAIRVCGAATDAYRGEARFRYQLARGFAAGGRMTKAVPILQSLAGDGYRAAQDALGAIYLSSARQGGLNAAPAVRWITSAAEAGSPTSQWLLGTLYVQGQGVEADLETGLRWLTEAAESGHPRAQTTLGKILLSHPELDPKPEEAARWLLRAAQAQEPEAQYFSAVLYKGGIGIARDDDQALRWLRLAAGWGHPLAQARLGSELLGIGDVPQDMPQAYFWLRQAERAEVEAVSGLIAYATDNLEADQRAAIDETIAAWRPRDAPPAMGAGSENPTPTAVTDTVVTAEDAAPDQVPADTVPGAAREDVAEEDLAEENLAEEDLAEEDLATVAPRADEGTRLRFAAPAEEPVTEAEEAPESGGFLDGLFGWINPDTPAPEETAARDEPAAPTAGDPDPADTPVQVLGVALPRPEPAPQVDPAPSLAPLTFDPSEFVPAKLGETPGPAPVASDPARSVVAAPDPAEATDGTSDEATETAAASDGLDLPPIPEPLEPLPVPPPFTDPAPEAGAGVTVAQPAPSPDEAAGDAPEPPGAAPESWAEPGGGASTSGRIRTFTVFGIEITVEDP